MDEIRDTQNELCSNLNDAMSLKEYQMYFEQVMRIRGFGNDSIEKKLLLLVEEVGELVKAVRKEKGVIGIDYMKIDSYNTAKEELADVLIVLFSVSNLLEIDMHEALLEKEKKNIERRWSK